LPLKISVKFSHLQLRMLVTQRTEQVLRQIRMCLPDNVLALFFRFFPFCVPELQRILFPCFEAFIPQSLFVTSVDHLPPTVFTSPGPVRQELVPLLTFFSNRFCSLRTICLPHLQTFMSPEATLNWSPLSFFSLSEEGIIPFRFSLFFHTRFQVWFGCY